jgi:DNA-binding FadR family transcriptional regulator
MNQNLVELTQKRILEYIAADPESDKLPTEQELTQILGVSRVVVREALSSLRILGLIETRPKSGSRLIAPDVFSTLKMVISSGLVDDLTQKNLKRLRVVIEIGAADYIFEGKNPEMMDKLGDLVKKERELYIELLTGDDSQKRTVSAEIAKLDAEFHTLLMEMTNNKPLIDFQGIIRYLFTLYTPSIREFGYEAMTHAGLYSILKNGTADEFRMAMRIHLAPLMQVIK